MKKACNFKNGEAINRQTHRHMKTDKHRDNPTTLRTRERERERERVGENTYFFLFRHSIYVCACARVRPLNQTLLMCQ